MCLNNVHADERPLSLFPNLTTAQCLIVDDVKPPLKMKGPLIFLVIHRPSIAEVTNHNLQRFIMTNPHGWDPYGTDLIPTNYCRTCSAWSVMFPPISKLFLLM